MEWTSVLLWALISLLLLGSAFFSSTETALFAFDEIRLKKLKDKNARIKIKELLRKSSLLLVTILLGNSIINTALTSILERQIKIDNEIVTTLVITLILITFGEVTPKTIALMKAESLAVMNSRLIYPFFKLVSPVTQFIDWISSSLVAFLSRFHKQKDISEMDQGHLTALMSIVSREGLFDK